MPMNRAHQRLCQSDEWARGVNEWMIPWALHGLDLGDDVLEIGPGYGPTTRALIDLVPNLTAVELDPLLAGDLERTLGDRATIVHGDGSAMPFAGDSFSAVVCFTMLHHIPSAELQDRLFAEARRVLRPGGVFAGSDSGMSLPFRLLHLGDTMVVVDPDTFDGRLRRAGFADVRIERAAKPRRSFRFAARKAEGENS
ncbi:class I SAM-dependent methyltransferase [Nonomuraea sp. CA-143628]|uniref:class I SAM-dependent methyltransferase n=1 Tax=Nonomuraea sp. CA-143628 TaxID=3239997 RepID=UPI003D9503FB